MKTNTNSNQNTNTLSLSLSEAVETSENQIPEQNQNQEQEQEQEQIPEPFKGYALEIKKQLINIAFEQTQERAFKIVIAHKTNPLLFPDITIAQASLQQLLAFAANGLNAVLNDNSGSRKPEKWAEIEAYLKHGFLTKSDYVNSLPKSKNKNSMREWEWVDEVIILTINQTQELDAERKSKLISRLYSPDQAIKDNAFTIAKAWIEALATVKADYAHRLAEWRQEQEQAAINPLLDAIDTL